MRYSNFKVREQCFFSLLQNSKKISKIRDQNIPILSEKCYNFGRHGIFPFFNGNPFFSGPFGSFLRSMQIRFNIFRGVGGEGHATLQQIYGLSDSQSFSYKLI